MQDYEQETAGLFMLLAVLPWLVLLCVRVCGLTESATTRFGPPHVLSSPPATDALPSCGIVGSRLSKKASSQTVEGARSPPRIWFSVMELSVSVAASGGRCTLYRGGLPWGREETRYVYREAVPVHIYIGSGRSTRE